MIRRMLLLVGLVGCAVEDPGGSPDGVDGSLTPPELGLTNPMTGAPYTADEWARIERVLADLPPTDAGRRLVPTSDAWERREQDLPDHLARRKDLARGTADAAAIGAYFGFLRDDARARCSLATWVLEVGLDDALGSYADVRGQVPVDCARIRRLEVQALELRGGAAPQETACGCPGTGTAGGRAGRFPPTGDGPILAGHGPRSARAASHARPAAVRR